MLLHHIEGNVHMYKPVLVNASLASNPPSDIMIKRATCHIAPAGANIGGNHVSHLVIVVWYICWIPARFAPYGKREAQMVCWLDRKYGEDSRALLTGEPLL